MEKANQSGVYTGPKNAAYAEQQQAEKCWSLECAKNGHPEAGRLRTSSHCGTKAQLHENRKLARRALNAICASAPNGEFPADVQAAFDFGAGLISRIDSEIDHHEQREEAKASKSGINAMRNHSDFARHYRTDNQFGDAGEIRIDDFLRGVANMSCSPAVRNALTEGTDSAGGYTVPSVLMPGILAGLVPVSSLLQAGASIIPLDAGGKNFTYAAVNAIPTAAWRSESGSLATSDATFRSVVATPRSLAFQFKISRELLADGQGISEALYVAIAASFARELDRVGLRGTGSAPEPRGVLNTSGIQTVTNGAAGASLATTKYANIFSAVQSILAADAPRPTAAIMSPRSLVGLGQLADTTGQPLRVPEMLKDVQLIGTSQIPNNLTVTTSTDCSEMYVGDFKNLYFTMREAISIQMLRELFAGTGEIGFACHMRADVVLTYPSAFALVTGIRP